MQASVIAICRSFAFSVRADTIRALSLMSPSEKVEALAFTVRQGFAFLSAQVEMP